jgi:hypothetical protein
VYATCLFCNGDLGRNEVIESFPVGRRLAFDAVKGRLWVVCRKCERWNLSPLEERWEAIEECERQFRGTTLRVSTDQIGLARLKEGLELVRIGQPQRPEMAAWRYGDQFGRRRKRHYAMIAGGVAVAGVIVVAGPVLGLVSGVAINPLWQFVNAGRGIYRYRTFVNVPTPDGTFLRTRLADLNRVRLSFVQGEVVIEVPTPTGQFVTPWYRYQTGRTMRELTGDAAIRAAGALLPRINQSGGNQSQVQRAVSILEENPAPEKVFTRALGSIERTSRWNTGRHGASTLHKLPLHTRLALEMAAHEDAERRALEGELHVLEAAWRNAEEIAKIADDMFVPESVETELARLKRERALGDRTSSE